MTPSPRRGLAAEIEALAYHTVVGWVGDRGIVKNTGDGPGPDFRIDYHDGRTGIGEVGWHADRAIEEMWANVLRHDRAQQIPLAPGSGSWVASSWGRPPNIKRLYDELPELVSRMLTEGVVSVVITGSYPRGPLADRVRQLGLVRIARYNQHGVDVAVFFAPGGGFDIPDANCIVDWFEQVLSDPDYADTTSKLLAVDDVDERHVFLMTGSRTEYGVEERIRRARDALPTRDPILPEGITHLWGVARFDAEPQAVLWSHRGWQTIAIPP